MKIHNIEKPAPKLHDEKDYIFHIKKKNKHQIMDYF